MKHTPMPKWTIEEIAVPRGLIYVRIKRGNETHASIGVYGPQINGKVNRLRPASVARARAKEITEACNAYEGLKKERDALLRAAQEALDFINRWYASSAVKTLREAIALCEGGAK